MVVFFSQLGELGINNALIKYVAAEFGKGNYQKITEYVTTSICILVIPSILIISTLYIFTSEIVGLLALNPAYLSYAEKLVPLIGLLSVFILFTELIKGVLMGIGRVDLANYIFLLGQVIRVVTTIALIIVGFGIWALYWGTAFYCVVVFLVYSFILSAIYKIKIFSIKGVDGGCLRNLLNFGGPLFSARIISMLTQPFNKVIIARYIGLSEVTYYEVALKGVASLRGLYEMGLKAIMPKVSELQHKTQNLKKAVTSIYEKSIKFILVFALPVFLGLFILSDIFLRLWLPGRYDPQISTILRWFLLAYIINLLSVPGYYIFMGIGKVWYCFLAHMITAVANIIIISFLVALNIKSLVLFVSVQSASIILSAIITILLFIKSKNLIFWQAKIS